MCRFGVLLILSAFVCAGLSTRLKEEIEEVIRELEELDRRAENSGGNNAGGGNKFDLDDLQRKNSQYRGSEGSGTSSGGSRKKRQATCSWTSSIVCDTDNIATLNTYRTSNGSCNNIATPNMGMGGTPQRRMATETAYIGYEDDVSKPMSTNSANDALPSPRQISTIVHGDDTRNDFNDPGRTHMVMQWGQFLAHDFASTPEVDITESGTSTCCVDELANSVTTTTQEQLNDLNGCLAIPVPPNDAYFTTRKCLNFVRSMQVDAMDCVSPQKEQLNAISSWIDASNVYGMTDDYMNSLRKLSGGMLRTDDLNMCPHETDGLNCVKPEPDTDKCFKAGDSRVNVTPNLMVLHILFVREHNKIAAELDALGNGWDDETLFQETRKIVGAMMQHITYSEYLPVILGVEIDDLRPSNRGQVDNYDSGVDARIGVEFSTAGFRFGHSMINSQFLRKFGDFEEDTNLSEMYGRTSYVLEESGAGFDRLLNGLLITKPERADDWYSTEISNKLFEDSPQHSHDLAARNIQRGRDHGIPTYNNMRLKCGLSASSQWDDSAAGFVDWRDTLPPKVSRAYSSPDDVELYTGGVLEKAVPRGVVGPLFACIIKDQFKSLRDGDRFWYERPSVFSEAQTNAIKKVTLARLICRNSNIATVASRTVFKQVDARRNPEFACTDTVQIRDYNFDAWKK